MKIPPKYEINPKIERLLLIASELFQTLESSQLSDVVLKYHRHKSILKSSLYSARIEGNQLDKTSLDKFRQLPHSSAKLEIANLVKTIDYIESKTWTGELSLSDLKIIHSLVMSDLDMSAGHYRTESSAIFNSAGIAVYLCPPQIEVKDLMSRLLDFANHDMACLPLVRIALIHYTFEKIHPFLDGNGRVGRSLVHLLLKKYGYSPKGMLPYEEYIDKHRGDYYALLGSEKSVITDFVEFILEAFIYGLQQVLNLTLAPLPISKGILLLPRRGEILALINDHPLSSFDFIHRRFMAIPPRTLRYDLKYLVDHNFIVKLGTTNGVIYSPASSFLASQ